MLIVFGSMSALTAVRPNLAATVAAFFEPGCRFFRTWFAAIFAPGFIGLPLKMPSLTLGEFSVFFAIIFVGAITSTATNAMLASALAPKSANQDNSAAPSDDPDGSMTVPPSAAAAAPAVVASPFPRAQQRLLAALCSVFAAVYFFGGGPALALNLLLLCATIGSYSVMSTLCAPRVQVLLHPFVTCSLLTMGACAALGGLSGAGFRSVLQSYASPSGAGGWLSQLMAPTVISFGFQLYSFRVQLRQRLRQILGTAAIGSFVSMLTAAVAARVCGLAPSLRVPLFSRCTLAPLALDVAALFRIEPALGLLAGFVTGLVGLGLGKPLLAWLRVRDPVVRGLALSGTAHGGALLALGNEPASFPFAALMLSVSGACSVALASIPQVRQLLMAIALGSAAHA